MLNPQILRDAGRFRDQFQQARPFRHVVIDDFLEAPAAESLLADFPPFDERKAMNEIGQVGRKAVVESVKNLSPFYARFYALHQLGAVPVRRSRS